MDVVHILKHSCNRANTTPKMSAVEIGTVILQERTARFLAGGCVHCFCSKCHTLTIQGSGCSVCNGCYSCCHCTATMIGQAKIAKNKSERCRARRGVKKLEEKEKEKYVAKSKQRVCK
jgi:hypothetical protein